MVYDPGLRLDNVANAANAEEVEIKERAFWGASILFNIAVLVI